MEGEKDSGKYTKKIEFPIECPETETKILSKANQNVVRYLKELKVNARTYIQPQALET